MIGLEVRWRRLALVGALAIVVAVASSVAAALGRRSLPASWRVVLSSPVRHVRAGGVDFAYRVIGSGRPLLLIEGTEATMASEWDPGVLAQLAASHRVIVYDPRGLGLSRGDVSHMTVAQLADDAAHLLGALHVRQADVWGQSLGGYVAQELTIRHPRDVRRLVLTGTSAGGGHWVPPLVPLPKPKGDDRAEILRITFTPGPAGRAAARAFEARVGLWRPQENVSAVARTAEWTAVAQYVTDPAQGAWQALATVRAPALVADGRLDVVAPPGNSRIIASRLPHATLRLYPSGHYFYFQDRKLFVPDLLRFLGSGS